MEGFLVILSLMSTRKTETKQKQAMREMMREYLKSNDICIKDSADVKSTMRDMMSVLLEGALNE
jgi:putative transposase